MKDKPSIALIDGDILTYRTGFAYEKEPVKLCLWNVNRTINGMLDHLGCSQYLVFTTADDKSNFRFSIRKDYKANRKAPRPKHYEEIRRYLVDEHKAEVCRGYEADDGIAVYHSSSGGKSVICSIDKDFKQLPGWHFYFVRKELDWLSSDEAESFFWKQVITGDRTDNIRGIRGMGEVKASKALEGCSTAWEYLRTVHRIYVDRFGETEGELKLVENLNLLRLKRTHEEELVTLPRIKASLNTNSPLY